LKWPFSSIRSVSSIARYLKQNTQKYEYQNLVFSQEWKLGLWSSGLRCCKVSQVVTIIQDGSDRFTWNAGNHLQDYTLSQLRR
jgi:hypothetical protein